jgi:hypothetical protein
MVSSSPLRGLKRVSRKKVGGTVPQSWHRPLRTVLYSGGDGIPQGLVEHRRGVIPRHVGVVAQSCDVRALNAQTCEQERGWRARGDPRARRSALERGGPRPRGRSGGPRGAPGLWSLSVCVFRLGDSFTFCVFYEFKRASPGGLGDPHGYPRQLERPARRCHVMTCSPVMGRKVVDILHDFR